MDFFPLFASLRDEPCLLVGGGEVAARKARMLLDAGARLTVNAPACGEAMRGLLVDHPAVTWQAGPFDAALVDDHLLVIAATADPVVNQAVAAAARAARRLCNVVDDAESSSFIVPAIVDRSPVIVAVSSGGRSPVLARALRQRLERWLPQRLGPLADWAGRWRSAVRERLSAPGARRRLWEELLGGAAARHVLDGDEHAADVLTRTLLDLPAGDARTGCAWLVGAGPGDPELITLRGLQVLREADVVLHDRLVSPELLRAARREADIICVGKQGGGPSTPQDEINRILVERVRRGQRVCRLKGGDPFIFGRGGEEALALAAAGLSFEIVPGVTAASGCAARAGIPLTHRGVSASVTLVSAQAAAGSPGPAWAHLAADVGTLAIYMGAGQVATIAEHLVRHGRPADTPAALVTSGTLDGERVATGTLADIGGRVGVRDEAAPGILIIGTTVALGDELGGQAGAGAEHGAAERLRDPILPSPLIRAG